MGALTRNRKRGGDSLSSLRYTLDSNSPPFDLHISKKPRCSPLQFKIEPSISSICSSQSTYTRVQEYPKPSKPLRREVHGPCRNSRFGSSMGNLWSNFGKVRNAALDTLKFVRKDKFEVVVDDEECSKGNVVSDDSTLVEEEVEILDDRRGGQQSGRLSQKPVEIEDDDDDTFLKRQYQHFANNQVQGSSSVVTDLSVQTPPRSDNGGTVSKYGFHSENGGLREVIDTEPQYTRLYASAQGRQHRLQFISSRIGVVTKKLSSIRCFPKKPEKGPLHEPLLPLTEEEEDAVSQAFVHKNRRKILVTHADSNIEITGEVLQCLKPGAWLNDEVINLYLELLKEREKREPKRFLKCHFFNTFFYKKLISGKSGYDFKAVKRWTTPRKIGYGLVECEKIFVPIHKEIHWCLAIINVKDKKFQYLDSLKGRDSKVLQVLAKYYVDEVKDKSSKDVDVSSWTDEYITDLPAQMNGFDCGMFMIKYMDFYSRGLELSFGQENMPYFRRRTVKEILKLKAE
ncbi:Ulp1 peptidase [Ranunculus cassubicifolius]